MSREFYPTAPVVSVVMPTYNGERFLRPAIESILNQTFTNFELIIIDDGSTDNTTHILSEFKDTRLTVLTNQQNLGIAAATNRGLAAARGEYIALQDSDDISLAYRFQVEVEFLNTNPEIALVGSSAILIDENDEAYDNYVEVGDDLEIKWESLFRCPISHTSVMVRRQLFEAVGGYSTEPLLRVTSDYDILARIAQSHPVANIREPLVKWRRHHGATMITHESQLLSGIEAVSLRSIGRLISPDSRHDPDLQYRLLGARAFVGIPAGRLPALPPEHVIEGLQFLRHLQNVFCQTHSSSRRAVARLRRRLNWIWGRHAVALAIRAPWDRGSRARIFAAGLGRLRSAVFGFWSL
jgi:hypothetical protein